MRSNSAKAESGTPMAPLDPFEAFPVEPGQRTAEDILIPEDLVSRPAAERMYPLWRVHYAGRPLSMRVHREEGCWLAENAALNICGVGQHPGEALADAEQHVLYFVGYYAEITENQVTGYAIELKRRFAQVTVIPE